ncbi:MAG: chorismate synthase [Sandaracinaceae bacterium]
MAGSSFGVLFRVTTAGESHGPANVVIVDGCPPGLPLSLDDLTPDLARRRPGQSSLVSQRKEEDAPEILSGLFDGRTTGTPIAVVVRNTDARGRDYADLAELYRPGHADHVYDRKYGFRDHRGGGRASARETVSRVVAGAIAKKLLRTAAGVEIVGYVKQVGDVIADVPDPTKVTLDAVEATPVRCPDPEAGARMIARIDEVRRARDSIGGVAEIVATNVPPGLGEPVFDKLKAALGHALLSLPAVLGVEYGIGFGCATMRGSENNDLYVPGDPATLATASNRHGGMLGGISSGMPIVLRAAIKPTSSIARPQATVNQRGEAAEVSTTGRHDPCLLPRFVPMGEAMVALVLADHYLRHRAVAAI